MPRFLSVKKWDSGHHPLLVEAAQPNKEGNMAQTKDGQKFERIPGHTRKVGGKAVKVKPHIRSNPRTSRGKAK